MFKKLPSKRILQHVLLHLTCLSVFVDSSFTPRQATSLHERTILNEPGVCSSKDIRNKVTAFSQLKGCQVVEGFVQIVLIDNANESDYHNISFPELREITDYLLLYRVQGMRSLGNIFPNLNVIRGNNLFQGYAFVIFEMLHLQEIGLTSLTNILRGAVHFAKNPVLCFIDTIDWDIMAPFGKGEHHISGNNIQSECPLCPLNKTCPHSTTLGHSLCWNTKSCQKVCPLVCNGTCNVAGECCNPSCLGGCYGRGSEHCFSCKNVLFENKCVSKCPANTYKYMNRRCVVESVCYDMPKPVESTDASIRHNPWKPFEDECLMDCKSGFREIPYVVNNITRHQCQKCEGTCIKECPSINVDSISAARKLRGCTTIQGALEIQIRGGSNVIKELEENLNMIEEIDHYLKIVRSYPLVSLSFLKKLKIIHGKTLESSKYALVVLDNQNLVELWDWETRENSFEIKKGKIFFHFNPKLCISKIDKLKEVAKLTDFTEMEVASSNGDKVACNVTVINAHLKSSTSKMAIVVWESFKYHDPRSLLGYVIYSIEAPYRNVSLYDGRDACGGDGWRVDDFSLPRTPPRELKHFIVGLKPYTQYACYIKTYTVATAKAGAQSKIIYFTTKPDQPTEPRSLTAYSNSSSQLVISWQPPLHPNGKIVHYIVTGKLVKYDEEYIEQRNYCLEPFDTKKLFQPDVKPEQLPAADLEIKTEKCPCSQKIQINKQLREKEIHFEDNLQNIIYVKRPTVPTSLAPRTKRHISSNNSIPYDSIKKIKPLIDSNELKNQYNEDGTYKYFSIKVNNSLSVVIRNLRHFASYNIAVHVCREANKIDKLNEERPCSNDAIATAKTLALDNADNIDSQSLTWEISNNSLGIVLLKWNEPIRPNGFIVTYQIEYKRIDLDNIQPTIVCITRKEFREASNSYTLKKLGPGNYSLRVKAISQGGEGFFTTIKIFYIKEDFSTTIIQILVMVAVVLFLVALALVAYFRRQYSQVPNRKLIASVNPEYVPTVYEPDDWEVLRSRVDLLKEIGQGSFGMVWEGVLKSADNIQDIPCAIKTVNDQAADRDRIEFLNEASVMKAFNTHHVVKLLGVVSQGQPTLVIMELMVRGDLKSYLRSHRPDNPDNSKPPSLRRIYRMAAEIADGMAYLSAKKFVHRDLAARNCMVASDLTVKIGDFGMTRDIYETEYYRKGTKGLLPVRWMAPESLKDGVFTSYSDAWSYGVVLYEMATLACQPYQGLSNDQVLRYVIEGGIMERPDRCPEKLFHAMKLCWQHKPSDRPSFLELVTLLQDDIDIDFQTVSFYHSEEGVDLRASSSTEKTPLIKSKSNEEFFLSEDEDYKEPHSSTSSKMSNGSTTPNGYMPQPMVKTTKC